VVGYFGLGKSETKVHQLFESMLSSGIVGAGVGKDVGRHLQNDKNK
jgi:hypothetical protein